MAEPAQKECYGKDKWVSTARGLEKFLRRERDKKLARSGIFVVLIVDNKNLGFVFGVRD